MNYKLYLILTCVASLLMNVWGCDIDRVIPTPQTLPEGITIIFRDNDIRIETSNRPRARYTINGNELHRWCPGDGVYYHILRESGLLQIDTNHDGNFEYFTYLKIKG